MKWTRASEDNLPRPEDMPKCGRLLGPDGIWYYGTIQMVAEIIAAARNKPLRNNRAMYTEWLDESTESSVWPGVEELKTFALEFWWWVEKNNFRIMTRDQLSTHGDINTFDKVWQIHELMEQWLQSRTAVKAESSHWEIVNTSGEAGQDYINSINDKQSQPTAVKAEDVDKYGFTLDSAGHKYLDDTGALPKQVQDFAHMSFVEDRYENQQPQPTAGGV